VLKIGNKFIKVKQDNAAARNVVFFFMKLKLRKSIR
jgi:hypothetical protein